MHERRTDGSGRAPRPCLIASHRRRAAVGACYLTPPPLSAHTPCTLACRPPHCMHGPPCLHPMRNVSRWGLVDSKHPAGHGRCREGRCLPQGLVCQEGQAGPQPLHHLALLHRRRWVQGLLGGLAWSDQSTAPGRVHPLSCSCCHCDHKGWPYDAGCCPCMPDAVQTRWHTPTPILRLDSVPCPRSSIHTLPPPPHRLTPTPIPPPQAAACTPSPAPLTPTPTLPRRPLPVHHHQGQHGQQLAPDRLLQRDAPLRRGEPPFVPRSPALMPASLAPRSRRAAPDAPAACAWTTAPTRSGACARWRRRTRTAACAPLAACDAPAPAVRRHGRRAADPRPRRACPPLQVPSCKRVANALRRS